MEGEEAMLLAGLAARFGDGSLEAVWVAQAARAFGELRGKSLAGLPARVVTRMLGEEGLAAESEDDVYEAAEAYVAERGEGLTAEERREVWACVRYELCSEGVRAKMMELEVAEELRLGWLESLRTPRERQV